MFNNTPTASRTEALHQLQSAATMLEEIAKELRNFSQADRRRLEINGDAYAQSGSTKDNLRGSAQDAALDMARVQRVLFDAVDSASRA